MEQGVQRIEEREPGTAMHNAVKAQLQRTARVMEQS